MVVDLGHVVHPEVVLLAGRDMPARTQHDSDVALRLLRRGALADRCLDQRHVLVARDTPLHGAQRQYDHIVLIGTHRALALRFQHSDHLTGEGLEPDAFPDRRLAAEKIRPPRRADGADRLAAPLFARGKDAAAGQRPRWPAPSSGS
jgi:hypothetical protein